MDRGRNETPAGAEGARGASAGPGPRGKSKDRSGAAANNAGLMKGKRPDNLGGSSHHGGGNNQKYKKRRVPKQVRKAVPKKVRKATGKGYKKVKKNVVVKPVKKFQNTTLGQRIAPREKCGTAKICSYIFAVILLIVSSIGLVIATGNADALTEIVAPNFDINNLQDQFAGNQIVGIWSVPDKTGLAMEILNALDDSWQAVFTLAVTDWEFGSPDALSLTSTKVAYDSECTPVDGKIKVCNGDYGEQPWRGLATCILDQNRNYANCNAKMNDYYLRNGELDLKQYTMCHEIGHGFGLPHTDEDFNNADLGNCLDYTENFGVNKSPDASNYAKLVEFYGSVGGARRGRRGLRKHNNAGNVRPSAMTTTTSTLEAHSKSEDANTNTTTTVLPESSEPSFEMSEELAQQKQTAQPPVITTTPPHIWKKRKTVLEQFESIVFKEGVDSALLEKYGWKVMEKTLFEVEHMIDLGDGYLLEVQISAP
mmetsp:Transcript_46309/g.112253  ORF Transcript_46309/g.112253 Transcript_46309/m.112253 type:complete len:481 (-) Transcript_46309:240-1682(-)|eukprot:CAMPEP_0113648878 /NCGR_PEP_ID=MMETSP0017_2-20120614/25953_1 /TAXON_ID=2856 /ORGANISM="Cylindrotheca closterium" /LENGTH=480 /DNA_ID=CAMNT_0000561179 /DNA_START=82 /DNA_END=1524 /DNA_ORIENTATION=- /assembly_acc=CAM_ASM_000147